MSTVYLMELTVLVAVTIWLLAAAVVGLIIGALARHADDEPPSTGR